MSDAWDLLSCLIISFVVTHSPDSGLTGPEGTIFPIEISAKPPKDNLSRGEIAYVQTLDNWGFIRRNMPESKYSFFWEIVLNHEKVRLIEYVYSTAYVAR